MEISELMLSEGLNIAEYRNSVWCLDTSSESNLPDNFRTMFSEICSPDPKYGMDPDFNASLEGLSTLNLSGSGQFSMSQLGGMAESLRELTGNEIHLIDIRQETHLLAAGKPVSLFGKRNRANIGMLAHEVEAQEHQLADALRGQSLEVALPFYEIDFSRTCTLECNRVMTERQAAQMLGFSYHRFAVTDRSWPSDQLVDQFVELVRSIDKESWVHIHCKAGKGRTGEFMAMYDMLRNPNVPVKDIAYRQFQLGSGYMLYEGNGQEWTDAYDQERARMTLKFHQYVQDTWHDDFSISWSEWLARG